MEKAIRVTPGDSKWIGQRLRDLRRQYGFTQRELARRTGVTNGTISMIEQNTISPSVASLKKTLDAFEGTCRWRKTLASSSRHLNQNRRMQVLHEFCAPGGATGQAMLCHAGEKAGVIVRGQVEVIVGRIPRDSRPW